MKHELSENAKDFIEDAALESLLSAPRTESAQFDEIIAKSLLKEPLSIEETAALLRADAPEQIEAIYAAARRR